MSRTKLDADALALQTYYVQAEIYELGRITDDFDGDMQKKWKTFCRKIDTKTDDSMNNGLQQQIHGVKEVSAMAIYSLNRDKVTRTFRFFTFRKRQKQSRFT
ncbi:MAG: hypothetical protein ACI4TA_02425 [Acetatifactor sp.]